MNPAEKSRLRTGDALIDSGAITTEQRDLCLEEQYRLRADGQHTLFGRVVLQNRFALPEQIYKAVEISSGVRHGGELPWPLRKRYRFIVIGVANGELQVGSMEPLSEQAKQTIINAAVYSGFDVVRIRRVPVDKAIIIRDLKKGSHIDSAVLKSQINELAANTDDGSLIQRIIDNLLIDAMQCRASDVHITRDDESAGNWISFRVDGVLQPRYLAARQAMAPLATRIKSESGMDFSETRRPQDGRMSMSYMGRDIDLRVGAIPRDGGESIVIRILDQDTLKSLTDMFGPFPAILNNVREISSITRKTGGLVLVTGATGSGKTSTLYAILSAMQRNLLKIMTSEDPIEYRLPMVTQTQVNEPIGLTFAKILRAQLRQDPDVLVVGEMRDPETVKTALQSAESGHLLMSTLHTDDVMQAITKMIGLLPDDYRTSGIYVLASMMRSIFNQRLVPKLCACAIPAKAETAWDLFPLIAERCDIPNDAEIYMANGCERCRHTGYLGRVLVPEVLFISADPVTRASVSNLLLANQEQIVINQFTSIPGVTYYSREMALKDLLLRRAVDLETALTALNIPFYSVKMARKNEAVASEVSA
jgi:general secretion pathway protein E